MSVKCLVNSCVYQSRTDKCSLKQLSIDQNGQCCDCLRADLNSLSPLNHLNYGNSGGVYCRVQHSNVNNLDACHDCPLWSGTLQGEGVECCWDDVLGDGFMQFIDPKRELLRVSNLIDKGYLDRTPSREGCTV